jgi:hypothetical protein
MRERPWCTAERTSYDGYDNTTDLNTRADGSPERLRDLGREPVEVAPQIGQRTDQPGGRRAPRSWRPAADNARGAADELVRLKPDVIVV